MQSPNPSPLRTLFLTEAFLKLLGGAIFISSPSTILKNLTITPHDSVSKSLIRNLGTQTVAFSVPLFLAARQDAGSVGSRRIVYWTLFAREGCLMVGILGQLGWAWLQGDRDENEVARAVEEGLVQKKRDEVEDRELEKRKLAVGMAWWVVELLPFVVGRLWVLSSRRRWFEV